MDVGDIYKHLILSVASWKVILSAQVDITYTFALVDTSAYCIAWTNNAADYWYLIGVCRCSRRCPHADDSRSGGENAGNGCIRAYG